jgi:Secretion system C-terminal sorting domain
MRKLFTLLLSTMCLSMATSQNYNTAVRTYKKEGLRDTFRLTNEYLNFYDKKTCLDTARTEFDQRVLPSSTNVVETKYKRTSKKYDDKKRVSEINRSYTLTNIDKSTGKLQYKESKIDKDKIFYTPANIKYDSIANEVYDTVTQKWVYTKYFLPKKSGFGNDTIRSGSTITVIDDKGRFILGYTVVNGKATDSTRIKYDNLDRFISYEYFWTHPVTLKFGILTSYSEKYEGFKLMQKLNIDVESNFDTTRTYTNYTYTNDILDLEERYKEIKTKAGILDYKERDRSRYTKYNSAKKCTEKVNEFSYGPSTSAVWTIGSINKMAYYQDTLIKTDSLLGYTNNLLNGIDAITNYEYETCKVIASATEEVNKGVDFTLAPNPSTGYFNIAIEDKNTQMDMQVSVYNIQGGEVFRTKLTSESTAIDLSNLSKGLYLVKVVDKTHFTVKKMVLN